jgi:hypothetical protein
MCGQWMRNFQQPPLEQSQHMTLKYPNGNACQAETFATGSNKRRKMLCLED